MEPASSHTNMKPRHFAIVLLSTFVIPATSFAVERPNILVFYLDDMGYGQPGCYGGTLAPTPNMDSLAAGGMRFTDGYVSACVCSPSRVGLLTGRYQSRTGHDANSEGKSSAGRELLLSETTIAQRLKALGYTTGIFGKWHVGATSPEFLPAARGFDESFGTTGNLGETAGSFYRGKDKVPDPEGAPITSPIFAREAAGFIERHRAEPWLLYLPFNAVHSPTVATESVLKRFANLPPRDQAYAALISEADDAIGAVLAKLRELKLEESTLIFVISDNGGAAAQAEMGGLRGRKWLVWEGGIRVPWIAAWKGRIPAGRVSSEPVIQLDVLPTALAAAGGEVKPEWQLDGVNLLPLLEGKASKLEREALYWRFGVQYAVRKGDWKLVKPGLVDKPMLVNLAADRGEQTDLTAQHPEKAADLQALWDRWNGDNQPPRWEDKRWNDGNTSKPARKSKEPRSKPRGI